MLETFVPILPTVNEPVDPRHLRASDSDRDRVAETIRAAAGDGRLTLEEVDQRLDGVYKARTYAELEVLTADLPELGADRPQPAIRPARNADRVGGTPSSSVSIAIMSGATRKGEWVVPRRYTAVALMGGVELDLRQARFAEQEVTIHAVAVMGGMQIIVPEDVDVAVNGAGIMGAFEDSAGSGGRADGSRPTVHVTGVAFWGGVEVTRKKEQPGSDSGHQIHH